MNKEVTINIPFTYTLGEEGPTTGKILDTVKACMEEVRAEIDEGNLTGVDVLLKVGTNDLDYKQGFDEVMCYFDSISDEERPKLHEKLQKLGL